MINRNKLKLRQPYFSVAASAALLIILMGCVSPEKKIEQDGVQISYTDTKVGDTTLLFVHGWVINKSYWVHQVAFFSKQYRVVTIDLPGFGESGKNRNVWSVENYGKDIAAVIHTLDLKNVVLVGHSMADEIITEGALDAGDRIVGLVGVDNFTSVATDPIDKKEITHVFDSVRRDFKITGRGFMETLFYGVSDSATRKKVRADFDKADPDIAVNSLRESAIYFPGLAGKLKSTHMKVHLINSDKVPFDTASYRTQQIPYALTTISGTGHFPMFEKPDEFNALLQEVLTAIHQETLSR